VRIASITAASVGSDPQRFAAALLKLEGQPGKGPAGSGVIRSDSLRPY